MEAEGKATGLDSLKGVQMSVLIATALDSEAAHTSFGKLPLADERSAPGYSFGLSTRAQNKKLYAGEELTVSAENRSPGPRYLVKEAVVLPSPPKFSLGKEAKGKSPQKYDYYEIRDTISNPVKSKQYTFKDPGSAKFGTSTRNPPLDTSFSPGPQYHPPQRLDRAAAPRYSLGARRALPGTLGTKTCTPALVGPGRYAPERSTFNSVHQSPRTWSIPRQERKTLETYSPAKHQTYDLSVSCGPQQTSRRRTSPKYSFGSASRDQVKRTGMFQDAQALQQAKVRIALPSNF